MDSEECLRHKNVSHREILKTNYLSFALSHTWHWSTLISGDASSSLTVFPTSSVTSATLHEGTGQRQESQHQEESCERGSSGSTHPSWQRAQRRAER